MPEHRDKKETWLDESFSLGILDHIEPNPVLDTAAGLQNFQFCCNVGASRRFQLI